MRHLRISIMATILFYFLCSSVISAPCTDGLKRAMKEEGLSDEQINLICEKAKLYDKGTKKVQESPDIPLIKKDLAAILDDRSVNSKPLSSLLKILSVEKTNGIRESDNQYTIEYKGKISLLKLIYDYGAMYSLQLNEMRGFDWALKGKYPANTQKSFSGASLYKMTENGWRLERYKIKIDDLINFSK